MAYSLFVHLMFSLVKKGSICFWEWSMEKYEFVDGNLKIIQIFQIIG